MRGAEIVPVLWPNVVELMFISVFPYESVEGPNTG